MPSEPLSTRYAASSRHFSTWTDPSSRNGVMIAVRISPNTVPILGTVPKGLSLEKRVQADRQARWKLREPLERQQHARDERFAGERVVADREQLARPAE